MYISTRRYDITLLSVLGMKWHITYTMRYEQLWAASRLGYLTILQNAI